MKRFTERTLRTASAVTIAVTIGVWALTFAGVARAQSAPQNCGPGEALAAALACGCPSSNNPCWNQRRCESCCPGVQPHLVLCCESLCRQMSGTCLPTSFWDFCWLR